MALVPENGGFDPQLVTIEMVTCGDNDEKPWDLGWVFSMFSQDCSPGGPESDCE